MSSRNDFNPLNGCDVSTTFDFSIDCAGDWFGDAQVLSYCFDTDDDGLGDVGSETDFCDAFVEDVGIVHESKNIGNVPVKAIVVAIGVEGQKIMTPVK